MILITDKLKEYYRQGFKNFYLSRARKKYSMAVKSILIDLREANTEDELYELYLGNDISTYSNIMNGFSIQEKGIIEDAAFFVRMEELNNKANYNLGDKEMLLLLYNSVKGDNND